MPHCPISFGVHVNDNPVEEQQGYPQTPQMAQTAYLLPTVQKRHGRRKIAKAGGVSETLATLATFPILNSCRCR
jgi:hypothetical protein